MVHCRRTTVPGVMLPTTIRCTSLPGSLLNRHGLSLTSSVKGPATCWPAHEQIRFEIRSLRSLTPTSHCQYSAAIVFALFAAAAIALAVVGLFATISTVLHAQGATCIATRQTMTPARWTAPSELLARDSHGPASSRTAPLVVVADVPLPGPAKRFDYQSFDPTTNRLYIAHAWRSAGCLRHESRKARGQSRRLPGRNRRRAVPELHKVYMSVTGRHQVAVVDARTLQTIAWVAGADFPDGIAYAPDEHLIFVSDEHGEWIWSIRRLDQCARGSRSARGRGRKLAAASQRCASAAASDVMLTVALTVPARSGSHQYLVDRHSPGYESRRR